MVAERLRVIADELDGKPTSGRGAELWRSAHALLKKTTHDPMKIGRVIAERSVGGLRQMIDGGLTVQQRQGGVSRPFSPPAPIRSENVSDAVAAALGLSTPPPVVKLEAPAEDELKSALKAFKKRLKVTQLDGDSKLSNRALTGGSKGTVTAIQPPTTHTSAVWEHLANTGKLKRSGRGMYQLVGE
ncbi:hypothetical protein BH11PLA1_BH11PLA1_12050 [soil metagenome]